MFFCMMLQYNIYVSVETATQQPQNNHLSESMF